jgi:hypothetical protein
MRFIGFRELMAVSCVRWNPAVLCSTRCNAVPLPCIGNRADKQDSANGGVS